MNEADNRFAAVGGIVLRGGDVLLVRHTYGGAAGQMLNPSGYIKQGEMPEVALKREIREETGVEIDVGGLLAVRCSPRDWWLVFLAAYASGEPRSDCAENSEACFIPVEEAMGRADVTDATKTLLRLAQTSQLMTPDEGYARLASSKGRMMFANKKMPTVNND